MRLPINKFKLIFYAITTKFSVNFVGRLMVAEIIAIAFFPFMNIRKMLSRNALLRSFLIGFSILLISLMLSDLYNETKMHDYLRGWSVVIFAIISTFFLLRNLENDHKNVLVLLFIFFLINIFIGEGEVDKYVFEVDTNYFKVRFVGFLNPLVMLLAYYFYRSTMPVSSVLIFILYSLVCFIYDARSMGLVSLISSGLLFIKISRMKLRWPKLITFCILFLLVMYSLYCFYVFQVLHFDFGGYNSFHQLSKAENPYNPFELIYYGRSDFIVLVQAVADKPIWGYGSWGKDPGGYYSELLSIVSGSVVVSDRDYIVTHSIFLGTWAYAGIVGFFATLYVYIKLYAHQISMFRFFNSPILPITIFLSVDSLWNYLFSPIGHLRTSFPVFAAIVIAEYGYAQSIYLQKETVKH